MQAQQAVAEQFQAGAADQTELLNAQFEQAAAAITQLDSQIKLQQAMGALEDAVQRPILPKAIFESSGTEPQKGIIKKMETKR